MTRARCVFSFELLDMRCGVKRGNRSGDENGGLYKL